MDCHIVLGWAHGQLLSLGLMRNRAVIRVTHEEIQLLLLWETMSIRTTEKSRRLKLTCRRHDLL